MDCFVLAVELGISFFGFGLAERDLGWWNDIMSWRDSFGTDSIEGRYGGVKAMEFKGICSYKSLVCISRGSIWPSGYICLVLLSEFAVYRTQVDETYERSCVWYRSYYFCDHYLHTTASPVCFSVAFRSQESIRLPRTQWNSHMTKEAVGG